MSTPLPLDAVARLPMPDDNVAIATRRLEAGTPLRLPSGQIVLSHTVLEGHRFAVQPILQGNALLSWGLPFGYATTGIAPGDYVVNSSTLTALRGRSIDVELPASDNFADEIQPYELDTAAFVPQPALPRYAGTRTFAGYRRPGGRGVGTRNDIVILGISSRAGAFVRRLADLLRADAADYANIDDIVAVAHTEGAEPDPNNRELLLRTLTGFMVHPNVGAVLAVGVPGDAISPADLEAYAGQHGYPLAHVLHEFLLLDAAFDVRRSEAADLVRRWYGRVDTAIRTPEPLSELKIALQCGGSDAFSGVSGNPLAAWVAREVIRYGGSANLAETDELIGAEPYVLQKVQDLATAEKFLMMVERFKAWAARHGTSAEGNPSGGNKYRGLYNITLKSIGAARKRDPDVRLDAVIDYGEPMTAPGYYFMDSPGNDLESIAGQVASGCNMIFFVTGNGSITNFPFVPTIKIVTTSERYHLLSQDMDVNAGRYLDGTPMEEVGADTLDLTVRVASGDRSLGERAGHAQVQIWRNWQRGEGAALAEPEPAVARLGNSLRLTHAHALDPEIAHLEIPAVAGRLGPVLRPVGLILPTSLCAGQVAEMAARRLNNTDLAARIGVEAFVALVHTEGCGCSPVVKEITTDVLLGYLRHPRVRHALLLEHGCEITHNDHMRLALAEMGLQPSDFGWASIQLDGGIASVLAKVEAWFDRAAQDHVAVQTVPLTSRALGLWTDATPDPTTAEALALLAGQVIAGGGCVVIPEGAPLLSTAPFRATLGIDAVHVTVGYGEPARTRGLHVMEAPTRHWLETFVGLGGSGVEAVIAGVTGHPLQGHPLVDLIQVTRNSGVAATYAGDIDLLLEGPAAADAWQIARLLADVLGGRRSSAVAASGNTGFQLTRGLVGISM